MSATLNFLVVEDDPVDSKTVCRILHSLPTVEHTDTARDLREAKQRIQDQHYDAVILDLGLPDSQGVDSVIEFQASAPDLPIVVLTGSRDERMAERSVDLGAEDCLSKDSVTRDSLLRALRFAMERHRHKSSIYKDMDQLRSSLDEALQAAASDPLTGLPNRRGLEEYLKHLRASAPEAATIIAVADLDHFKAINDEHGHDVGDEVLKEFSKRLLRCLREGDFAARVGGDEFVIIFNGPGRAEAAKLGQRILDHVAASPVSPRPGRSVAFSATLAMLELGSHDLDLERILGAAHPSLLRGKDGGRQRLECAWSDELEGGAEGGRAHGPALKLEVLELKGVLSERGLGYRLRFGAGPGLRMEPVAGRARLNGDLRELGLECARRAAQWRALRQPGCVVHLDLEADAVDSDFRVELNRLMPDAAERRCTVLGFHSKFQGKAGERVLSELQLLRKAGFQLALHGVGDGSTVLEHLALLRPDWLRLDPVLTHNAARFKRKQEALALLVGMLHPLGASLIAEACEGPEDLRCLAELGFQGFEAPMP